ncbi:hypothetical protein [Halorubrum spindle-shaped virus-BLv25]|nr:hypothetical protein [Halorubrum spindle-shaped virus-BLv25]
MSYLNYLAAPMNYTLWAAESVAYAAGFKLQVVVSDHSVKIKFVKPDKDTRAWDSNLFKNANLFVQGYANPFKPRVEHNSKLENPDTIDIQEGEPDGENDETDGSNGDVSLIASSRYRDYMRQDLVSQLLTPKEQWKLIAYGVLAIGVLQFLAIIVTLYATGTFA